MNRLVLQSIIMLGFGIYVMHIGRATYSSPDTTRERWFFYWPNRPWVLRFVRGMGIFWIFTAFSMFISCIAIFPFLAAYRGLALLVAAVAVCTLGTLAVLSRTPRRNLGRKPGRHRETVSN